MKKFLLALLLLAPFAFAGNAVIYKSESCGHCTPYIEKLYPLLQQNGFQDIQVKDFINDQQARAEVAQIQKDFNVPLEMQGHMLTLLDGKYLFEGHVQLQVLEKFLQSERQDFSRVVVTQDSMDENSPQYLLLGSFPDGSVKQCSSAQSVGECSKQGSASTESLLKFKVDSNIFVLLLLGLVLVALVLLHLRVLK
ncbi:MAG TPA: hypothetical protein VJI71_00080 [Candidatus Norongarragalinales archaeon]|nr:hypothetical protein [Candidatus Norongarragalinales archaeon]